MAMPRKNLDWVAVAGAYDCPTIFVPPERNVGDEPRCWEARNGSRTARAWKVPMDPIAVSAEAIASALKRVLSSRTFENAGRSSALLRFLVEETVNGRADRLKEYTLGAEALGRGEAFDPRTDPIVRAEASRLRSRLERYYSSEGAPDPVVIELPKGTYV